MDNWDEAKLEDVVNKKHGETNKSMPKTAIVSYFLRKVQIFRLYDQHIKIWWKSGLIVNTNYNCFSGTMKTQFYI